MSLTVALAGKGGTGKTTVAGLLISYMINNEMKPILAVDADSNSNLNDVLGVHLNETLGDARELIKTGAPNGMTKDIFMEMKVAQAVVECDNFDLIAMGRPEGPGCYCAANNLLGGVIDSLVKNYNYLVIDNEAGMEHISRLTRTDIDFLILVSDPSYRSLNAACRIVELIRSLPMHVEEKFLVVNRVQNLPDSWPQEVLDTFGKDRITSLQEDSLLSQYDLEGKPTILLPDDSLIVKSAIKIFNSLFK